MWVVYSKFTPDLLVTTKNQIFLSRLIEMGKARDGCPKFLYKLKMLIFEVGT